MVTCHPRFRKLESRDRLKSDVEPECLTDGINLEGFSVYTLDQGHHYVICFNGWHTMTIGDILVEKRHVKDGIIEDKPHRSLF